MGVLVQADGPDGGRAARLGGNGSQVMLAGYLFAAYAVAGRPESNRACAWVGPGWTRHSWHPDAPFPERNQPRTVAALIAYSVDEDGDGLAECGFCFAQNDTITLGVKMRPVTDPMLADLVSLWQTTCTTGGDGTVDSATVARLASHLDVLQPHLVTSTSWYGSLVDVFDVFRYAATAGTSVTIG